LRDLRPRKPHLVRLHGPVSDDDLVERRPCMWRARRASGRTSRWAEQLGAAGQRPLEEEHVRALAASGRVRTWRSGSIGESEAAHAAADGARALALKFASSTSTKPGSPSGVPTLSVSV